MKLLLKKLRKNESGNAMVEMAIMLPLLLLFVFSGLEYSRSLERAQWVSQLSREAANVAYRDCVGQEPAYMGRCLNGVISRMTAQVNVLAPGSEFIIAVYGYRGGAVIEDGLSGSTKYLSKFRNAGFRIARLQLEANNDKIGTPGKAIKDNELVVVGTAYSPMHSPVSDVLPGMHLVFPSLVISTTIM